MRDYKTVRTTYEVWAAIRRTHPEMVVFGSYSAPDGDWYGGDTSIGKMFTSWGFESSDYPIIEAETTWDINHEKLAERLNEQHKYWLCLPIRETD